MKRGGNLLGRMVEADNLREAFFLAARGKWSRPATRRFALRLDEALDSIRRDLLAGVYCPGPATTFVIHDPKERRIHAAPFRDRVVHHAVMRVVGPIWDRKLIHHTYACRPGRGTLAATRQARRNSRRFAWFVKCDIRKYFDSIRHDVARRLIARTIKDAAVLRLLDRLLASHSTFPGAGLPIGSLVSQHLANLYLDPLDRWICARPTTGAYVRYMDDLVVWVRGAADARATAAGIREFVGTELQLALKQEPICNRVESGFTFLGCHVSDRGLGLSRRSRHRLHRRLRWLHEAWSDGRLDELGLQQRATSLFAFARRGGSLAFRRRLLARAGPWPDGLEPRDPRGRLEQPRQELPVGEPQQELAVQPEQQPGLPPRLRPSSTRPEGRGRTGHGPAAASPAPANHMGCPALVAACERPGHPAFPRHPGHPGDLSPGGTESKTP